MASSINQTGLAFDTNQRDKNEPNTLTKDLTNDSAWHMTIKSKLNT